MTFQLTPNILVCSDETKIGGYRVEGQALQAAGAPRPIRRDRSNSLEYGLEI